MKNKVLSLISIAIALILPSCIEYETEVTLNKDGSGTITEEMVLSAQALSMMQMTPQQEGKKGGNPLTKMKDEATLKEKAKSFGEGVTFVKSEEIKRADGSTGVRVTYKFNDINKIKMNPGRGLGELSNMNLKGQDDGAAEAEETASFKYVDGTLTISLPQPENAANQEGEGEEAPAATPNDPNAQMMAGMLKGMKISAKLTIPDGIAETNATFTEGNTITMMELNMDEVIKTPGGMAAFGGMQGKDANGLVGAMQKMKGVKAETKKEVTVKLK